MSKVSIIIPVHNCAKYITESIDSVLSQTYRDFELIVVDDGSTDNLRSVLNEYIDNGKILYLYQPQGGPGAARNSGIHKATGNYIAFLDADDLWDPSKLEKQFDYLRLHEDILIVHTNASYIDENGRQILINDEEYNRQYTIQSGDIFEGLLLKKTDIVFSSLLFNKDCLSKVGLIDESLRTAEDTHFLIRLAKIYKFGYIPEKCVIKRAHKQNLSSNAYLSMENNGTFRCIAKIYNQFPDVSLEIQKKSFEVRYFDYGSINFKSFRMDMCRLCMKLTLKYNIFNLKAYIFIFLSLLPKSILMGIIKLRNRKKQRYQARLNVSI